MTNVVEHYIILRKSLCGFSAGPEVLPGNDFNPQVLHDQQRAGDQTPQRRAGV